MRMKTIMRLLVSGFALGGFHVEGATVRVPQDHAAIQAAIEAARDGDEVVVGAGTYRERIRLKPELVVRSAGEDAMGKLGLKRAEATIIDGGGAVAERLV